MEKQNKKESNAITYSVIIPAFNAEKTLFACLDSLTNQSLSKEKYEIIVVDDGSTDMTAELARKFDIVYIYQSNRGPAAARNRGAGEAVGEIILFTDSDCEPEHRWIEEMIQPFKNSEIVGVKGCYKTRQKELAARFAQSEFEDRYELLKKSLNIDMVDTYSAAYKKEVFNKMGGFDEKFPVANNEDTDLSYRMSSAGCKLVFNPGAFVYHIHPNTFNKYLKVKFWRGYWRIVVYRRFPEKAFKDSYTPAVIKFQTMLMAFSFPVLLLSVSYPGLSVIAALCWIGIMLLSLPFSIKTYQKDRTTGMISPVIILLRSFVFAAGSLSATGRFTFNLLRSTGSAKDAKGNVTNKPL